MKIKKLFPIILLLLLIITLLASLIILFHNSSFTVIVKNKTKTYFTARSIFILGNNLVCYKGPEEYKTRKDAYKNINEDKQLTILTMDTVAYIEIIPDPEEEEIDPEWLEYTGAYRVHVSGHEGYLYIRYKNNRTYGTIRFPDWANGVHEPLKQLRINRAKKTITFTRSITDMKELRRIGAPSYFTQKFYGKYSYQGKVIKGKYINQGARSSWEGEKLK